jgi:hypothetical protein
MQTFSKNNWNEQNNNPYTSKQKKTKEITQMKKP